METLEDIYIGSIETDRGTREQVRFYDTRGLRDGMEFPRHYYSFADGFVLVYSIDSKESFKRMEALKKDIDRHRDKKEVRTEQLCEMSHGFTRHQRRDIKAITSCLYLRFQNA